MERLERVFQPRGAMVNEQKKVVPLVAPTMKAALAAEATAAAAVAAAAMGAVAQAEDA